MAENTLSHTARATNIHQKRDAEQSDVQYTHEQGDDAPGASRNAQPSENLGALYETIFIQLQQVIALDVADDADVLCSRIARIAADRFREYRNEEKKLAVAMRCEKLFDVDALLHGAHDVSGAHSDQRALLAKAMQAVDRATDILGTSPDWNANDLIASSDRAAMDSEPARATAHGALTLGSAALEAAEAMADLRCIADLLFWIENARHITSFVEFLVKDDKRFAERLTANGVAGWSAMWDSNESDGLQWLINQQRRIAATAEQLLRDKVNEAPSAAVSRAGEPQHG